MIKVQKNLRVFYQSPDRKLLAAESSPQLRTIKVRQLYPLECTHTFYLGFPYMQFYLVNDGPNTEDFIHLTFSKKPVLNVKRNKVYFPFLPNVFSWDSKTCLILDRMKDFPTEEDMERAIGRFWNTSFYIDSSWFGNWSVPSGIRRTKLDVDDEEHFEPQSLEQFEAWEEGTREKGVNFISKLKWSCSLLNLPMFLTSKHDDDDRSVTLSIQNKKLAYIRKFLEEEAL